MVSFPLVLINQSICIHTGFPDVARSQNHNLHRLVGHAVHQGVLRNGDQQKVARPAAAAGHGSWRRVASQPHLALLGNTPEQQNPLKVCSSVTGMGPARRASWNLRALLRLLLLTRILCNCVQSSKSPKYSPGIPSSFHPFPSFSARRPIVVIFRGKQSFECVATPNRRVAARSRCPCAGGERGEGGRKTRNHPIFIPTGSSEDGRLLSHILTHERNRMRAKMFVITSLSDSFSASGHS